MKVTKEKTESSQAFLTIEMEPAEVEESLEQAYHRLVKRASVPGFRKGKAPRPVLERHVGREHLLENALDSLIPDACEKAIKEQGIEAFAQPRIEVTQIEPVVFKAIVPLKPSVKLGDYHHLSVESPVVAEVTNDQVEAVIQDLRHQYSDWESIELRSADFGDLVVIDLEGNIEGKPIPDQKAIPYQLQRNLTVPVPGFAEQLVGIKKGEVKEFKIKLPDNYSEADLVGKEVSFKVKVNNISQEVSPELNDQFASRVNLDFKTLAQLREYIANDLKRKAEERALGKFEENVIAVVVGLSQVEYPPILVETDINQMVNLRFPKGREEMETYLKRINKTAEAFYRGLRPLAESRVARSLVLDKVSEEEKIEVSEAEIDAEIDNVIGSADGNKEENRKILNSTQNRETIKNNLLIRKTVQRLVEIAKSSTVTEPAKEEEEKK